MLQLHDNMMFKREPGSEWKPWMEWSRVRKQEYVESEGNTAANSSPEPGM